MIHLTAILMEFCFSQLNAIVCTDVDNDGIKDIIIGKRYYAYNGRDIGAEHPAVLYWFKTTRNVNGTLDLFRIKLIMNLV
jgi:hypothetical protein